MLKVNFRRQNYVKKEYTEMTKAIYLEHLRSVLGRSILHYWYYLSFLFHGQIAIERGFNVNKDLLVENLNQQTLTGQWKIYDYFSSLEVDIN